MNHQNQNLAADIERVGTLRQTISEENGRQEKGRRPLPTSTRLEAKKCLLAGNDAEGRIQRNAPESHNTLPSLRWDDRTLPDNGRRPEPPQVTAPLSVSHKACTVDGCGRPSWARGFCKKHYNRWWQYGDAMAPLLRQPGPATAVVIPPGVCKRCGKEFTRDVHHRFYCSRECSIEAQRQQNRDGAKRQYWADPEAKKAYLRDYYRTDAGREYHKAYNAQHHVVTCTVCGAVKHLDPSTIPDLATYVCRDCQKAARRNAVCYWCEEAFTRTTPRRPYAKDTCSACFGLITRLGEDIGVSRERARQLINAAVSGAAVVGLKVTRKAAADHIRAERRQLLLGQLAKLQARAVES